MFLSVENIKDLKSEKYISYDDFKNNFRIYPEKNDILMTRIGDIGTTNIVKGSTLKAYYVSLALLKCKNINPYYLNFAIKSDFVQNGLKLRSLLTAIPMKINKDQIGEVDINYPINLEEQSNIGKIFDNIDNLITLHQRKFNDILVYKLSTKFLFLKLAKNVWEQRKFGDYGTVSMCKRIFKNETSDSGDIPFYKIGTFGGKADAFISNDKYEYYKSKFSYPNKGDILLSASGTIGRIVEYTGEKAYFQDSNIVWLNHNEDIKNVFLKVLYPTVKWDGIEGSTIKRLYNSNFLNTCINIPNTLEQDKIGELFANLDNLITLHHRKYTYIFYSWEQRKAKDLCSITTGKSNTQDQVQDGKYPFYIRSDVPVRSNRYLYDEEAVITIGDGNIGRVFHYVNGKFDLHQRCYKMADFKALTAKYFYYYFSTKFYERAMSMTAKATVDSVRLEMISDMEIKFPKSTIEQTNISELLTNLDNLITLHQHKELKRRNDNNEHLRW